jgi:hypothetical protein
MVAHREGMLRPEFQEWYPSLEATRWYPAAQLADLVREHLQHGSPQWRAEGRVPSDDHFAFRGGVARPGGARYTRAGDRAPSSVDSPGQAPRLNP